MKKRVVTVAFLLAFAMFSVMVKTDLRKTASPLSALQVGTPMGDFELQQADGQQVTFKELAVGKKVVVLNFWASWCGPCRVEMPSFSKLYTDKEKDGLLIVGINEDVDRDEMDAYLRERPVSFPVLIDPGGSVMKRFGVRALPTTVLVDSEGKIFQVQEGIHEYLGLLVETQLKIASMKPELP